jgi:hypothetical protein
LRNFKRLTVSETGSLEMAKRDRENLDAVTAIISVGERPWVAAMRTCVAAIILSAAVLSGANAASPKGSSQEAAAPPQIAELTALPADLGFNVGD